MEAGGDDDTDVAIAALRGAIAAHESANPDRDAPTDVGAETALYVEALRPEPGQQRSAAASPVPDFALAPPPLPPNEDGVDDDSDFSGSESGPVDAAAAEVTPTAAAPAAPKPPSPVPDFVQNSPPPPPPPPDTDDTDDSDESSADDHGTDDDEGRPGAAIDDEGRLGAAIDEAELKQFQVEQRQEAERLEEEWRVRAAHKATRQRAARVTAGDYGYGDRFVLSYESEVNFLFSGRGGAGMDATLMHSPGNPCTFSVR